MKIAIDTGPLKTGDSIRGIGVYTRELAAALESFRKIGKSNFEIHAIDYFNNQSLTANHYDTIHFTRFNPFRISVPFKKPIGTKFVLTIYDLIPLIYPDHYPPGVKGKINWEINKHLIRKNVDSIVTISVTSKKDICRFIGVDPRIVHVTHLAPRQNFEKLDDGDWKKGIKSKYNLPDHFALYVGDINYNKNIPCLIEATKFAVRGLTLSLAEEYRGTSIDFCLITLGSVLTSFGPMSLAEKKSDMERGKKTYFTPNWVAKKLVSIVKGEDRRTEYTLFPSDYVTEWKSR